MTATQIGIPFEILISVTQDELDQISAIIAPNRIARCVVAENNIAAFHHEGPKILENIANALPENERTRLKTWDELDDDTRESVVGMAAGGFDWAEERHIDSEYINEHLGDSPELKAALLNP